MNFLKKHFNLKTLILLVFILRSALSLLPPMAIDQSCWRAWSQRLVDLGPAEFYSETVFTANPPGFLYVFWLLGEIKNSLFPQISFSSSGYDWFLKLPNNLADIAAGVLIYLLIKTKRGIGIAKLGFLLYTLNPITWFNSSVYGQFDGSAAFFGLLAVYLLLTKRKLSLSAAVFALAWAIKPQLIALAPALGLLAIFRFKPIDWFKAALAFISTTLIIYWPFFPGNPVKGIISVFQQMANLYSCASCFTFNFWGLWGNWFPDTTVLLGLSFMSWGIILVGLNLIVVLLLKPLKLRYRLPYLYLTIAISILSFNMLVTRMHERYVFPFFAFFLLAAILMKSRLLFVFYLIFSIFNTFNVYYPYSYYNPDFHLTPALINWLNQNFQLLSVIGLAIYLILLTHFLITLKRLRKKS
ncbi:MAG: hypothetical protein V1810_01185 [Candidatus Beckwithbacteria bacterium]